MYVVAASPWAEGYSACLLITGREDNATKRGEGMHAPTIARCASSFDGL
jgi:hypothetical protein